MSPYREFEQQSGLGFNAADWCFMTMVNDLMCFQGYNFVIPTD